jgi:hypothetical protein
VNTLSGSYEGAQEQVVVDQREEAEVDVADAGPLEMVKAMALVEREDV